MKETVRSLFNSILIKHYERLTGTKNAAGGLPLTLDNIGCFVVFGGRELDMFDITSEVSERYTMEEFFREAREAGIEQNEFFHTALQEMFQIKYIEQQSDGYVYGYSDTKETARTLNRIFPKMQGVNLLAYIWQTIAEVHDGRTELQEALSRFDQTLQIHGVLPPKPKIPVVSLKQKSQEKPPAEEKKETKTSRQSRIIRDYVVTESTARTAPTAEKSVLPSPVNGYEETSNRPETPRQEAYVEVRKVTETEQEIQTETEAMKQKIAQLERTIAEVEKEKEALSVKDSLMEKKEEAAVGSASGKNHESPVVDDEIARKIEDFEKELALTCPVCKTGTLQEKSTAAGKIFYACKRDGCNFISWGRPHHVQCIRCKNSFLIEVTNAAGQTVLRCPRATCQHLQSPGTGGGVKVVRKRLVRRKP